MIQKISPLIRRAVSTDAELLAELGTHTFSETFAADNAPEDMAAYLTASFDPAQQRIELADSSSTFLIAEIDGVAAGYAKLYRGTAPQEIKGDKPIELARLYASKEWHGRGVGEALMRALLDEARRADTKLFGSACGSVTCVRKRFTASGTFVRSANKSFN